MVKTSLYLVSLGVKKPDVFDEFATSWWRAVEKMKPMPDEIIICATIGNNCKILEIPLFAKNRTSIVNVNPNETMSAHLNTAVDNCKGKWISWVGIDDLPLENLFSSVETAEKKKCEVILSGIKTTSGQVIFSNWERLAISSNNTVMSNTVCTKNLWRKAGGYPDVYFNDWGFWIHCFSLNPKIYKTQHITMLFNDSETHIRRSGQNNRDKFKAGILEIDKIKSNLNLKSKLRIKIVILIEKLIDRTKILIKIFKSRSNF
jgi:hypothetical protein